MKKMGLICMALVIALGIGGIGYASWTDQVTIGGSVGTGSLDIVIEGLSYVEVWKDFETEEAVTINVITDEDGNELYRSGDPPAEGQCVAYTTTEVTDDDEVSFTFNNLFPCDWFLIDVKLHCVGTVPVKINDILLESNTAADWVADLIVEGDDSETGGIYYEIYSYNPEGHVMGDEPLGLGAQLEDCDWIVILIWVHIPQHDDFQSQTGAMTMTLDFIQWNAYEE